MDNKKMRWAVLALFGAVAMSLVFPPMPKPKPRAKRIQAVNHLATASTTLPGINNLPTDLAK